MIAARRKNLISKFLDTGFVALAMSGCGGAEAPPESAQLDFRIDVAVTSDPGRGTPGAEVLLEGRRLATTDGAGQASVTLHGADGDTAELTVRCPAGFEAPALPMSVSLRRLSEGSRAPHYDARCAPKLRTVVVGVRTESGPNLPVLYLGREVARTDAAGAAHFLLSVKPAEAVSVVLDTTQTPKGPKLQPQSPTLTFVAQDRDDFVALEQRFTVERARAANTGPVRTGPTKI